jgi:hypothetical protein
MMKDMEMLPMYKLTFEVDVVEYFDGTWFLKRKDSNNADDYKCGATIVPREHVKLRFYDAYTIVHATCLTMGQLKEYLDMGYRLLKIEEI